MTQTPIGHWLRNGRAAPFIASGVLALAALLKSHQIATDPAFGVLYGSRTSELLLIAFELCLAVGLLAGFLPQACRAIAVAAFLVFACMSAYYLHRGESCGCFGAVRAAPIWTLALDVALLTLLSLWRPRHQEVAMARIVSWGFLGMLALPFLAITLHFSLLLTSQYVAPEQNTVAVDPEEWLDKPFRLLDSIDVGDHLATGKWRLLFYHHDCPNCRRAIMARLQQPSGLHQLALIEVPPYDFSGAAITGSFEYGRLNDLVPWLIRTPVEFQLQDGIVVGTNTFE